MLPPTTSPRPMPFVGRQQNGGIVFASFFARAHADGPGALTVDLTGRGLERFVLEAPSILQGIEGMRWAWADPTLSILVEEEERSGTSPRVSSYKSVGEGWRLLQSNTGYFSAVKRDDSVLAIERTAYEVPNSSIYPKGSGYEENMWALKPARIAVLAGKASAPVIPAGLCPKSMSAAADGTLIVAVDKCDVATTENGVLRYPPKSTRAKVEWFVARAKGDPTDPDVVATFAAGENEIYVGVHDELHTWDGKEWKTSQPFRGDRIGWLSRAPSGQLWAVTRGKDVLKREGTTWTSIPLPKAPADRLDAKVYALPSFELSDFVSVAKPPDDQKLREEGEQALVPYSVDATAEEILVLAVAYHEAFLLSNKPRTPVARLPSIPVQRAQLAQTLKRQVSPAGNPCLKSVLVFPEGSTVIAVKDALGDAAPSDAGKTQVAVGEGTIEGQKHVLVYGEREDLTAAAKKLASLSPKRLCGPGVIEAP